MPARSRASAADTVCDTSRMRAAVRSAGWRCGFRCANSMDLGGLVPRGRAGRALASFVLATVHLLAAGALIAWMYLRLDRTIAFHLTISFPEMLLIGTFLLLTGLAALLLSAPVEALPDNLKPWRMLVVISALLSLVGGGSLTVFSHQSFFQLLWQWRIEWLWDPGACLLLVGSAASMLAYLRQLAIATRHRFAMHFCEWLMIVPGLLVPFALPGIGRVFLGHLGGIIPYLGLIYLPTTCAACCWFGWNFWNFARMRRALWESESEGES